MRPSYLAAKNKSDPNDRLLQVLQEDEIHYADQPIAVVVATTLESAQEAAHLVSARYAPASLSVALSTTAPDTYAPKKAGPVGPADSKRGDFASGLKNAAVRIDQTYTTPVQNHNPMEPHALTVVWQGDDHVTPCTIPRRASLASKRRSPRCSAFQPKNVRVISRYVGGGFGCKGSPWSHIGLAALAARVVKRPVKLALTRQQMFSLVGHRPPTIQHLVLAADRAGKLIAISTNPGPKRRVSTNSSSPPRCRRRMLYACPNVITSHRLLPLDVPHADVHACAR
ncbi:MAG: molybdopterin cofactor-binding domain-containing protein [Pseudomonadota bacterium]